MDISVWIRIAKKELINRCFPFICILCNEKTTRSIDLCFDCEKELAWLDRSCIQCATPVPLSGKTETICGLCLKNPLPFYKVCIPFSYTGAIKKLIIELKFHQKLLHAKILGSLLEEHLRLSYKDDQLPDVIIPVPLHKKRLQERGYNQSIEIAKPIKKKLKVSIDYKSCLRARNTLAQSKLSSAQRQANVKNAFTLSKHQNTPKQHIALLDDVMTTGHTLTELSHILYNAGTKRIDVWCCARAHPGSF